MKSVTVPSSQHQAPGEIVDNDDFAVLDDIGLIPEHGPVCFERVVDVVLQLVVFLVGQIGHAKKLFCLSHAGRCENRGFCLLVDDVICVFGNRVKLEFVIRLGYCMPFESADKLIRATV